MAGTMRLRPSADPRAPGIYQSFDSVAPPPLSIANTRISGFVGITQKGPMNEPTRLTNWDEFVEIFGLVSDSYTAASVYGFFKNGGTDCWVVRVAHCAPKGELPGLDHASIAAQYVLDKRIPLEICLISNVHTGATPSLAEHPFKIFYQEKFRVTLNTDNRLMSDTTMTREFEAAAETFGLGLDDFEKITINAMKSAFLPYRERCNFIYAVIKPGYAKIRESVAKGQTERDARSHVARG